MTDDFVGVYALDDGEFRFEFDSGETVGYEYDDSGKVRSDILFWVDHDLRKNYFTAHVRGGPLNDERFTTLDEAARFARLVIQLTTQGESK